MSEIREVNVQRIIWYRYAGSWQVACPNKYAFGWECDVLAITKSGYSVEYEIKLSRSDFLADASKSWYEHNGRRYRKSDLRFINGEPTEVFKHDLLKEGKGPNRFVYVMPRGLVELEEIPDHAGVVFFNPDSGHQQMYSKRKAPRLHGDKAGQEIIDSINTSLYYKIWQTLPKSP